MQPKMATPDGLTKEIESHPDVVFTDPDEDMLKKKLKIHESFVE